AVDIGGSGLRVQVSYGAQPGPVRTAPGVRIQPDGIDVPALTAAAQSLVADEVGAGAPDVVVWSMRGLLFLADRAEVMRTVRSSLGAGRTVVVSDAVANLVGALGGLRPGAVVAAGTGAVAFGTDFADTWRRVDGWGHVLGDVGSAAWLGLEGLRAALRSHDGLPHGSSVLLASGTAAFGEPATWPRQVMNAPDAPERLARFAPAVAAAAEGASAEADPDPVAVGLCALAGEGLAEALLAAARGLPDPVLTATGGVLGAAPVRIALQERLSREGCELTPAVGGALDGARLLGTHLLETGALPAHAAYLLVD
ncbi:MAG: BadF/BadG/BcrA/BcrD ATPase family protein, partial [Pedococcus sp.]